MATVEQCRAALEQVADALAGVDPAVRRKHTLDRTLSCTLTDLGVTFTGRIDGDGLHDLTEAPGDDTDGAQIRLTMVSDDLLLLTQGDLNVASAWTRGRVRIEAGVLDLLRLRQLF